MHQAATLPVVISRVERNAAEGLVTICFYGDLNDFSALLQLQLWEDFQLHEVTNADQVAAHEAVQAWGLAGSDLHLEFGKDAAEKLRLPRLHHLRLNLQAGRLAGVADQLIEVLVNTCYLVELPGLPPRRDY